MPVQPPRWASPIEKPRLLVVEGQDEYRLVGALLKYLGREGDFDIRSSEGVGNLNNVIYTLPGVSGFAQVESLGVIRDADQNARSAFQSVCSALRNARLSVPEQPLSIVGEKPRVSVFIWPDCQSAGTLETLCLAAVHDDPAMECVEQYFECLARQLETMPKTPHKAHLHTFLASREKPGLRLGEAAEKGYWPWDHAVFESIKQFLLAM
jgi:hypothetical protein